jgi:hypothetical protein
VRGVRRRVVEQQVTASAGADADECAKAFG